MKTNTSALPVTVDPTNPQYGPGVRRYDNDAFGTEAFVLIVHDDAGDFIGAACDTWSEADERRDDYDYTFCSIVELEPGEALDLNAAGAAWGE